MQYIIPMNYFNYSDSQNCLIANQNQIIGSQFEIILDLQNRWIEPLLNVSLFESVKQKESTTEIIDSKKIFLHIVQNQNFCCTKSDFLEIKYHFFEDCYRKVIFQKQ